MPDVIASLPYLARIDDKPFTVFAREDQGHLQPEDLSNIKIDWQPNIHIRDLKQEESPPRFDIQGFTLLPHKFSPFELHNRDHAQAYQRQTETILRHVFNALVVECWDLKRRLNKYQDSETWDYNNPTEIDRPIEIAHCDHTFDNGIEVVGQKLSHDRQQEYLNEKYRVRMVNTWRLVNSPAGDQPLAICDCSTVEQGDLILCDRIVGDHLSEMYMLKYNPLHRWYWTDNLTKDELYIWITWDSQDGSHPKYCPHTSFKNPEVNSSAPPRESIETRSIVITTLDPDDLAPK